jgi:hypothetical protein
MNDILGQDLSWFWREWFYTTDLLDQAVDSVRVSDRNAQSAPVTEICLSNRRGMVMPVKLRMTFADGTTQEVKLPVDVWRASNRYCDSRPLAKELVMVEIDHDQNFPDADRSNNIWRKGP